MYQQPDLLQAECTTTTITVTGANLDRTIERLHDLGAVILAINVKGATYALKVILPPGELLAEALAALPDASQVQPCRQRRRSRRRLRRMVRHGLRAGVRHKLDSKKPGIR